MSLVIFGILRGEGADNLILGDAAAWGYLPQREPGRPYEPTQDGNNRPFTLHLIGDGNIEIPEELSNVVVIHRGLGYIEFYALMQSMDVVLPAFVNLDCLSLFNL